MMKYEETFYRRHTALTPAVAMKELSVLFTCGLIPYCTFVTVEISKVHSYDVQSFLSECLLISCTRSYVNGKHTMKASQKILSISWFQGECCLRLVKKTLGVKQKLETYKVRETVSLIQLSS